MPSAPTYTTPPGKRSADKQLLIDSTLRGQIVSGELKPGQRLPTWDELEKQFGVSRVTLMRGIAALKADGFIIPAGSRGTFVADHPPHLFRLGLVLPYRRQDGANWSQFWEAICVQAELITKRGPYRFELYSSLGWHPNQAEVHRLHLDATRHRLAGVIAVAHAAATLQGVDELKRLPIPSAAIASDVTSQYAAAAYPDLPSFRDRAMGYVAQRHPGARVGMIIDANRPDDRVVETWRAAADAHGLVLPRHLIQCAAWAKSAWAAHLTELMVRLPERERPEALVIADEHLLDASLAGLHAAGVAPGEDLTVISHSNFPPRSEPQGVECIGFDVARLLQICIDAVLNPAPSGRRARAVGVPALLAEEWHAQQKQAEAS